MNDLLRELAPISSEAWKLIDDEAGKTLKLTLAARKLVDFSGPHGMSLAAVNLGQVVDLAAAPNAGVEARQRKVAPLIELRAPFTMTRRELENVARGGRDPDVKSLVDAARQIAIAEDRAVFHGFPAGSITGIGQATEHAALTLTDDFQRYPEVVAEALGKLRIAGIAGPYGIALGPRCYTGLTETLAGGYPIYDLVRRLLDGPVVWAPAIDGAVVLSLRGGDFELTVGQDFSIGYLDHDAKSVQLYLQESFTFRVLTTEAAIPLRYETAKRQRR
jgi:uncharacterized linocin/CFP29 family protein